MATSTDDHATRRAMLGGVAMAAFAAAASRAKAEGPVPQVYVIEELIANSSSVPKLRALLVPFAAAAKAEPGCVHYSLMEVHGEAGHFLMFEIWADQAAFDAHMATPQMKTIGPKLANLVQKPLTQMVLHALT